MWVNGGAGVAVTKRTGRSASAVRNLFAENGVQTESIMGMVETGTCIGNQGNAAVGATLAGMGNQRTKVQKGCAAIEGSERMPSERTAKRTNNEESAKRTRRCASAAETQCGEGNANQRR